MSSRCEAEVRGQDPKEKRLEAMARQLHPFLKVWMAELKAVTAAFTITVSAAHRQRAPPRNQASL